MVRRSTPQKQIDERAFPVRVKFRVPPCGLGGLSDRVRAWLARELAPGAYAWHAADHAAALYFRTLEEAQRLVAAFPEFELADGTTSAGYTSPTLPFARR